MSAPVPISVDPAPVPNPVDPAEEDEDEQAAYSSSDSEGEEDTATERRPQFHTSAFIKFLTDATHLRRVPWPRGGQQTAQGS